MKTVPQGVRGLDPVLYKRALAEARKRGMTIGQWLNQAMELKLAKEKHLESG